MVTNFTLSPIRSGKWTPTLRTRGMSLCVLYRIWLERGHNYYELDFVLEVSCGFWNKCLSRTNKTASLLGKGRENPIQIESQRILLVLVHTIYQNAFHCFMLPGLDTSHRPRWFLSFYFFIFLVQYRFIWWSSCCRLNQNKIVFHRILWLFSYYSVISNNLMCLSLNSQGSNYHI